MSGYDRTVSSHVAFYPHLKGADARLRWIMSRRPTEKKCPIGSDAPSSHIYESNTAICGLIDYFF
ncbi:unnamed protein product [Clonostachys rosea f. rosea IK726]|uniref:Uncharacterized protein n=2 Tax=Bionectria ochroleuca TaxID=29856 RepID=A0A0B7KIG2_BIOOC|nr:unnamed protein product [Clonostachys rosea f. rosea IK726]